MNDLLNSEAAQKILHERALKFALEKIDPIATVEQTQLLVFNLGNEQHYAIDFSVIKRVIPIQAITPIPGIKPFYRGLIYHISEIWPVIDLNILLNCAQKIECNFILIDNEGLRYAWLVGEVIEQQAYDQGKEVTHFAASKEAHKAAFVQGIYKEDIAIIDSQALFNLLRTDTVTR